MKETISICTQIQITTTLFLRTTVHAQLVNKSHSKLFVTKSPVRVDELLGRSLLVTNGVVLRKK